MSLLFVWISYWWLAAFFSGMGWLVYRYLKLKAFAPGPVAIGKSLGLVFVGEILGYLIIFLLKTPILMLSASQLFVTGFDLLKVLLVLVLGSASAITAMRVTDDTGSMNLAIVSLLGLLPHTLCSAFGLIDSGFFAYLFFGFPIWTYATGRVIMARYPDLILNPVAIR